MSTIASPRDRRLPVTPTSSNRTSLEASSRSLTGSPNPQGSSSGTPTPHAGNSASFGPPPAPGGGKPRANRAALREYYNLRRAAAAAGQGAHQPPLLEVTDPLGVGQDAGGAAFLSPISASEVPASATDVEGFDADAYGRKLLDECGLDEVLSVYARVLGEMRALDAEKKALVYDNYSKLISATETIRKMRTNMDPLAPMASTLDPVMAQIYTQASSLRDALRQEVPPPAITVEDDKAVRDRRTRTRELARIAATAPDRMRMLVAEGRVEEARTEWEMPRRLLDRWRQLGQGGDEVGRKIEEGDAVLRGGEGGVVGDVGGGGGAGGDGTQSRDAKGLDTRAPTDS